MVWLHHHGLSVSLCHCLTIMYLTPFALALIIYYCHGTNGGASVIWHQNCNNLLSHISNYSHAVYFLQLACLRKQSNE